MSVSILDIRMGTVFLPYLIRLDKEGKYEEYAVAYEQVKTFEYLRTLAKGTSKTFIKLADKAYGTLQVAHIMMVAHASYAVATEIQSPGEYNYAWAAYEMILNKYISESHRVKLKLMVYANGGLSNVGR